MKFFTSLSVATLAVSVAAELPRHVARDASVVERDLTADVNAIEVVTTAVDALAATLTNFTTDVSAVQSASSALVSTIDAQAVIAAASGNLTIDDALTLASTVSTFITTAESLVADFVSAVPAVEAGGFCTEFEAEAAAIQSASSELINAIVAQVPAGITQEVAEQLVIDLDDVLQEGVYAFTSANCTNAVSSSSTTSSATSTTSSVATSSSTILSNSTATSTGTSSSGATKTKSSASTVTVTVNSCSTASGYGNRTHHSSTGTIGTTATASSTSVQFTGAAVVNSAGFGVLALAAAALVL